MKKILENPIVSFVARAILAYVFIYAAYGKIIDARQFSYEIANYNILPDIFINMMALVLPWLELFMALCLLIGFRLKANAAISAGMNIMFIAAISIAMMQGLDINCGCFANSATKVGWQKLAEDAGLLILSVYIFIKPVDTLTIGRFFGRKSLS